jgi:multidrug efflux system outer membrane protein
VTRLWPAVIALGLAACAGPRPDPPGAASVVPPEAWRIPAAGRVEVGAQWWSAFHDPGLDQVVEAALAHNTDIAIAAARVSEARAAAHLAAAQRLPDVSAIGAGARERDVSPFGTPQLQTFGEGQLSISYDTDLFGRLAKADAAARAALLASAAGRDSVRLAVAATAASGYINLCALDARLAVLRSTLQARADALKLAKRLAEAGYSPRLDEQQAEAEHHAAEQLIPVTLAAISRQEDALAVLLGEPPRAIVRDRALTDLVAPDIPPGVPARLLRRRPDLAQAEQSLVASDRTLDSARAAFLPRVELTASGGYVASTLLNDPVAVFALGGSVLAPIFDGGRLRAQQGLAVARRDQAAFSYRKTALVAFQEVEDALALQQRSAEQVVAISAQRDALASVLGIARRRYRAGYSPYLEELDAERGLLAAELALVQARADRLTAAVTLFAALGGGWRAPAGGAVRMDSSGSW